ncbi:MAG: 30S ribosomal protein THX [Bacteroidales bacterium]|jgi:30S ribosomal protein S31|nr:30S ribosomal protein THX [Bacteroidales bacterium]NPV36325.1 30S ribosomal protein THX [Bacteroidales bacterium]
MGKGDKRSKRGKIVLGTYGVRRPRKRKKATAKVKAEAGEMKA